MAITARWTATSATRLVRLWKRKRRKKTMAEKEYIDKVAFNYAIREAVKKYPNSFYNGLEVARQIAHDFPAADVRPVAEIEKIIESLQEQADIYNARAKELLVEEDGQVSQYTWAVSLRETYRRIIKTLDDLIS
jgi:hypothetical protein